jgi:hypothetical protein
MLKASPESPRMFENDIVDFFSRTHPGIVPILFAPAVTGLLWYSVARAGVGVMTSVALFGIGSLVWTFVEYWLHRTFFHWLPGGRWGERMHFLVHGS